MLFLVFETEKEKELAIMLYEKYSKFMLKVAFEILNNKYDAEDALQQAFIKISKNIDKINELDEIKTRNFIGLITRNTAIDMYNKIKKEFVLAEDDCAYIDACDISELIITKETYNRIKKLINNLKPCYREIIFFKFEQNLTYKDIAKLLNITEENARKRIERARTKILNLLEEEDKEFDRKK